MPSISPKWKYSKGNYESDNRDLKGTSPHNYFPFESAIQTVCVLYRSQKGEQRPKYHFHHCSASNVSYTLMSFLFVYIITEIFGLVIHNWKVCINYTIGSRKPNDRQAGGFFSRDRYFVGCTN